MRVKVLRIEKVKKKSDWKESFIWISTFLRITWKMLVF